MPKITFQHSGKSVDADEGEWMFEVAERAESGIPFACKAGACGTCATPVVEGIETLGKVTAREARTLTDRRLDENRCRLPCLKDVGSGDVVWGQPVNAPETDREAWSGPRGRCTDLIDRHVTPADAEHTEVYLCGGRPMIESCCEKLTAMGFPEEALRYERFF